MAKTYNTVADRAAGDLFTEAMWDDSLKTNLNNLVIPCVVYAFDVTATVAITTATWTAVAFASADAFDSDTMHDPAVTNTRITINTAGIYLITGRVEFAVSNTGTYREAGIRKNGTVFLDVDRQIPNATLGPRLRPGIVQNFIATDYVELVVRHDVGANLNIVADGTGIYPSLSAVWLGKPA